MYSTVLNTLNFNEKKYNGSKAPVSKWHPFIHVGHEQMAGFGGGARAFNAQD